MKQNVAIIVHNCPNHGVGTSPPLSNDVSLFQVASWQLNLFDSPQYTRVTRIQPTNDEPTTSATPCVAISTSSEQIK